jgi:hypothetical protein
MSTEIRTASGKLFGLVDREDGQEEFVIVNNKKVTLHDVYQDKNLFDEFNDEVKSSKKEITDVAE